MLEARQLPGNIAIAKLHLSVWEYYNCKNCNIVLQLQTKLLAVRRKTNQVEQPRNAREQNGRARVN